MHQTKYSVIIPTRERAETLHYSLKTCLAQDYEPIEIIVCDNASLDNTRDVAMSFGDERIRYINPGKRLGMTSNWDFALSHVTGDFVTCIGDDDGLLPHTVSWVHQALRRHPYQALIWQKADYNWPQCARHPDYLRVPLNDKTFLMNGKRLLKLACEGLTSYGRFPCIYSGFVSMNALQRLKKRSGRFLWSCSPDVYSGFALISEFNEYLYTFYPLGINGGSQHSNGQAYARSDDKKQEIFVKEMDLPHHKYMKVIPGIILSAVLEPLLQANDHCFGGKLNINLERHILNIVKQASSTTPATYQNAIEMLQTLPFEPKMIKKINRWKREHQAQESVNQEESWTTEKQIKADGSLILDASEHNIQNVNDASQFLHKLLPPYQVADTLHSNSWVNYLYTELNRRVDRLFKARFFG